MAEIINRKWKDGKLLEETKTWIDWEPNEADLDTVTVQCVCGNAFPLPRDCIVFGFEGMCCGECGEEAQMVVKNDYTA